jgi:hypothetical protein
MTDNKWEYNWDIPENYPTICPINNQHFINPDSISYEIESKYIHITNEFSPYEFKSSSVFGNTQNGHITITLPSAVYYKNKFFVIKKTHANNSLIINPYESELINGVSLMTLTNLNHTIEMTSNGVSWTTYTVYDNAITSNDVMPPITNSSTDTLLKNKGSLIVYSGTELCEHTISSNNYVLSCNSSSDKGIVWIDVNTVTKQEMYVIKDIKSIGSAGGTFTRDLWITRTLNNLESINGTNVTLNNNEFTLQSGKWALRAICPAFNVNNHTARIYNVSDTVTSIIGTSSTTNGSSTSFSEINGIINISSSKIFRIQHICSTTRTNNGLGNPTGYGSEVYTTVILTKLSN